MNPTEIMQVLEQKGAVLHGHFLLSSGRHSDLFVQKFRVLEHPRLAQRFGESISELFGHDFDLVACPAVGAVVLGFTTALAGGARMIFAERAEGEMAFRRGFEVGRHDRVLVVEDVVTTGGSAREVVDLARRAGGKVVGVGAFIDRSDPAGPPDLTVPLKALLKVPATSWAPEECPLCRAGQPLTDPGSRRLSL
ncbi:MAG: orotate phosphoribosyltransferase [Actinomycetota bacterium]|nr:orotate phosphoribosyltransferase [Actinomycetota bacterium]